MNPGTPAAEQKLQHYVLNGLLVLVYMFQRRSLSTYFGSGAVNSAGWTYDDKNRLT
jgi:hypothetical protein